MDTQYLFVAFRDPSVLLGSLVGNYTIQLGTSMPCESDCRTYLLQPTIPFTWNNISDVDNLLVRVKAKVTPITLTPAYYTSIPTLVMAINCELKNQKTGRKILNGGHNNVRLS